MFRWQCRARAPTTRIGEPSEAPGISLCLHLVNDARGNFDLLCMRPWPAGHALGQALCSARQVVKEREGREFLPTLGAIHRLRLRRERPLPLLMVIRSRPTTATPARISGVLELLAFMLVLLASKSAPPGCEAMAAVARAPAAA